MSYTTIKALWPGEKNENLEELSNGHGSGPVLWMAISEKYLHDEMAWLHGEGKKVWSLWKNGAIPKHVRACLMLTFDRAYVLKKDYLRAAKDIRLSLSELAIKSGRVNHWPRIAEIFESNSNIPAIGLWCTSVSDDPFEGPWNEKEEKHDPLDWNTTFDVYKNLDNIPEKVKG